VQPAAVADLGEAAAPVAGLAASLPLGAQVGVWDKVLARALAVVLVRVHSTLSSTAMTSG
jgi:hypothetical protein